MTDRKPESLYEAIAELSESIDNLKLAIADALMPSMNEYYRAASQWFRENRRGMPLLRRRVFQIWLRIMRRSK